MTDRNIFQEAPQLSPVDDRLAELYEDAGRSLDDLPYTPEFEGLAATARREFPSEFPDERAVFEKLLRLRKAAILPRHESDSAPIASVDADDVILIEQLVRKHAGSPAHSDRLPYTKAFEELFNEYNAQSVCRKLTSRHQLWRVIARIAK